MPKDDMGIKDKVQIVLTGPDGKVKDKREAKDERPGTKK